MTGHLVAADTSTVDRNAAGGASSCYSMRVMFSAQSVPVQHQVKFSIEILASPAAPPRQCVHMHVPARGSLSWLYMSPAPAKVALRMLQHKLAKRLFCLPSTR